MKFSVIRAGLSVRVSLSSERICKKNTSLRLSRVNDNIPRPFNNIIRYHGNAMRNVYILNKTVNIGIPQSFWSINCFDVYISNPSDRLCDLVERVLGYRSGGPGSIPGTTRKKVVDLERDPLSLVSTTEELLDRKVAAPV
jgi:hypothetical protein